MHRELRTPEEVLKIYFLKESHFQHYFLLMVLKKRSSASLLESEAFGMKFNLIAILTHFLEKGSYVAIRPKIK